MHRAGLRGDNAGPTPSFMLHRILDETRIDVVGDDAREWLGGQVTCDLREVNPGTARYGLVLGPKGRIISDVWVLDHGDSLSLAAPTHAVEALIERLERYLVMEDVDLERSSKGVVSIQGEDLPAGYEDAWDVPRVAKRGRDVWSDGADELAAVLGEATSQTEWEDARIRLGRAKLGHDIVADALPQELGLRSAVSFDKGCYIGQEPVVMLEHRGKPRRRLVQLHFETPLTESVELPKLSSGDADAGQITSLTSDRRDALALLKRKYIEEATTSPVSLQAGGTPATTCVVVEY